MAIITISRGSYIRGKEIAQKTAQKLGHDCISREVILKASKDFNIPELKLINAIENPPSFLDRFTHGREKYIAYTQAALLNRLKNGNVVYHGFAGHFFVKDIPYVLKVRIISELEDRIKIVMERDNILRKEALRFIKKIDEQRRKWDRKLYGIDPQDPSLYDIVLHIDKITVEDAVNILCQIAGLKQFQTTSASKRGIEDLALAAEVKTFLIGVKPRIDVCIENKYVTLKTEWPITQKSELFYKMEEIKKSIPGIKRINLVAENVPTRL